MSEGVSCEGVNVSRYVIASVAWQSHLATGRSLQLRPKIEQAFCLRNPATGRSLQTST